jgi:hypothetical protein
MFKRVHNSAGVIQADTIQDSTVIMLQNLGSLHRPEDIDQAISNIAGRLDKITWDKSMLDLRFILAGFMAGFISIAIMSSLQWPYKAMLYTASLLTVIAAWQMTSVVRRLNIEAEAAKSLLAELYKLRLHQIIDPQ